ncbi:hypothetical protein MUO79_01795, partial [Candidatus Bathyarchaeota archaeon]|nr:hypothetical protein [Candidatus Bathyarchaeota archaeon]
MQVLQEKIECPRCNSHDIHKKGFSKDGKLNKQRYLCFECNYRFVLGGRAKPQFKAIKQLRKRGEIKQLRIEKVILKIKTQKVKIPKIPKVKISVKTKV